MSKRYNGNIKIYGFCRKMERCGMERFGKERCNFILIINDSRLFDSKFNIAITVDIAIFLKTAFL